MAYTKKITAYATVAMLMLALLVVTIPAADATIVPHGGTFFFLT